MNFTQMFVLLWVLVAVLMIAFSVTKSRLIFRLRELYPAIYAQVGNPRAFSRSTEFLWRLNGFLSELSSKDRALRKTAVSLLFFTWATVVIGVACVVIPAIRA